MKTLLLALLAFVCAVPIVAFGQSKGDMLVVIKEVELTRNDTVVKRIRPGSHVKVLEVKADKLLVSSDSTGWILRRDATTFATAVETFNALIKNHPKESAGYVARAIAMQGKGDLDAAIADFTEGLRRDPKQAEVYLRRGNCYRGKKELNKAIDDFSEAIHQSPNSAEPYCMRADTWDALKNRDKSIADYSEALRINPNNDHALNQLAWLRATCADARYRDGRKAIEYGSKLCELSNWQDSANLDTVSAALAEAGQFETAVKWQTKAVSLAPDDERADYQSRLNLYKMGKAYHEVD